LAKKPAGKRAAEPRAHADPYLAQLHAVRETLTRGYRDFADRGPLVLLFDVEEVRVYVYPFDGFRADLSLASQASLDEQWRAAQQHGEQVVFVRDNSARRLRSYSLNIE
jgi:hypothetical protein